jgi:thiamine-phosphate pyrophosphorylase
MSARLPPPIVALTPGDVAAGGAGELRRRVALAFGAGLRGVVLREAGLGDRAYLELARELRRALAREAGGWLCLHDRPHLAREVGADAVHLGGRSLPLDAVRDWLDAGVAIGLSTHADDDPATWRGADYVVHGPVQRTAKPQAREPIGFEGLARAAAAGSVPVWALGGLEPRDARAVRASGARGLAVWSGILPRGDPAGRARSYVEAWETAGGAR